MIIKITKIIRHNIKIIFYPKIWQIKAVNNISTKQAQEVIKLAKQNVKGLVGYLNN